MASPLLIVHTTLYISADPTPLPYASVMINPRIYIITFVVMFISGCISNDMKKDTVYNEPYRPQFHFSPEKNWMNDPNGLVYHEGEYHLFYQYNPFGNKWGHMSWGHAVSPDLVHWEHLPVALQEEDGIMIFSGSAVIDHQNTSGFGSADNPAMVAIYTGHTETNQSQHIAYSTDKGRTWTKYASNPVLDIGMKDFRDPKVFWHNEINRWIMVIAIPIERKVHFYASEDLKSWAFLSDFGPAGATGGIWECPDLFLLPIEGEEDASRWVLDVNIGSEAAAGGSGGQYFVGDFDGERFMNDNPDTLTLWIDHGADYYAAVSWSDIPETDGRRILIGWMNNWQYAQDIPTDPWRSAQSLPRTLTLRRTSDGLRLAQRVVREFDMLATPHHTIARFPVEGRVSVEEDMPPLLLIEATFDLGEADAAGIALRYGEANETLVGYDAINETLFVDRTKSGNVAFHEAFPAIHTAKLITEDDLVSFKIYVDRSSIEVFGADGLVAITDRIFPEADFSGLSLWSRGGAVELRQMEVSALESTW